MRFKRIRILHLLFIRYTKCNSEMFASGSNSPEPILKLMDCVLYI